MPAALRGKTADSLRPLGELFDMCGIAASFSFDSRAEPQRPDLNEMCERMKCRGPDGSGTWTDASGRVVLAHRRLSIIDLSANGAQPMVDPSGELAITFNGEIYNYRELRRELESQGYRFRTESDTEVLLKLYSAYGRSMVSKLRGMFAFALWDGQIGGLLLARDHFGIKPLYVTEGRGAVQAASEVKALLSGNNVDTSPQAAGHVGFFLWGHVPEPYTLYRGIRALPAGTTLWIEANGKRDLQRYASFEELFRPTTTDRVLTPNEVSHELRAAMLESVRYHLVADVEVGVFLSAGLDSATLTALTSEVAKTRVRTVTLAFEEFRGTPNDESVLAAQIAARYGSDHTTVWVTQRDFENELDRLLDRMDQPSIDGINTYFVARAAAESGLKVALSGLGGDELFAGYPSFRQVPRLVSLASRVPAAALLGRVIRTVSAPVLKPLTSTKYASLLEYGHTIEGAYLLRRGLFLPWELECIVDPDLLNSGLRELQVLNELRASISPISATRFQLSALEASWYMRNQLLRDTDWASMSHSLEVRVPLVDWKLWQTVAQLIRSTAVLDKQSMASTPSHALPRQLLDRPKTGFRVPTREWIARDAPLKARGLRGWAQFVYEAAA